MYLLKNVPPKECNSKKCISYRSYLLNNVPPKECTSQGCHRGSDHSKTAVLPSAKQNVVAVVACCGLMVVLACLDAHAMPPKRMYCLKNIPPEES